MAKDTSTRFVVYAALAGNLLVALTKAAAAVWTGSTSMMSEAIHSGVDTLNEVLLLYGMRRSQDARDAEHPLGYGRELYFWSFVVAVLIFALGAGVSVVQGIQQIRDPHPIENVLANYIVLALAAVFEGASWFVSLRQFRAAQGPCGFFEAFRRSKDPPSFLVLFEDSAALTGLAIAAAGSFASVTLDIDIADGIASLCIGLLLGGTAMLLARESKSLLIGERADNALNSAILKLASAHEGVARANGLISVQMAPEQVVVALSIEFADELRTPQIETVVVELEKAVRAAHPVVIALFIKPQTSASFRAHAAAADAGTPAKD